MNGDGPDHCVTYQLKTGHGLSNQKTISLDRQDLTAEIGSQMNIWWTIGGHINKNWPRIS